MPTRETSRIVEISGRRWKIGKFDPLTGNYILLKLFSRLSHVAMGVLSGAVSDNAVVAVSIANEIGSLSKQEIVEIQAECLAVCAELTTVSEKDIERPIRLPDGRWAVSGIEDDALLVITLVGHVLLFNLSGFFDANALKASKDSFQGLIPFNA